MKIYDISATISENLPTFNNELLEVKDSKHMSSGDYCNTSRINFGSHTGTHCDVPSHFIPGGDTIDEVSLDRFYGKAKVVRLKVAEHVKKADLLHISIEAGDILLLDTGQSPLMRNPKFHTDYIALTPEAAEYLVEKKVKTIGIDYLSIEPYGTKGYETHKFLLGGGMCILEGLVLEGVPEGEYILSALPLKFAGGNGSPVRAVLIEM